MKLICTGCYYCCNCLHLEFKRTFILKRVLRQVVKKAKGFCHHQDKVKRKNYKWFNWEVIFLLILDNVSMEVVLNVCECEKRYVQLQ